MSNALLRTATSGSTKIRLLGTNSLHAIGRGSTRSSTKVEGLIVTDESPTYMYSEASVDGHVAMLNRQRLAYDPFTEDLFRRAGIGPGMRVLDVGSGTGDVAFIAATLVGPTGSVVCAERDPAMVATIANRIAEARAQNIEVVERDLHDVPFAEGSFDAVVGRLILMYQPSVFTTVASLTRLLRSGGVMAFVDLAAGSLDPPEAILFSQYPLTASWIEMFRIQRRCMDGLGTKTDPGFQLPAAYLAAGLEPDRDLRTVTPVFSGEELIAWWIGVLRNVLPIGVARGLIEEGSVDIDELSERLRAESGEFGAVGTSPPLLAAWARKP